jgi:hypothetical protein
MGVIHADASTGWPAPMVRRNVSPQAAPDPSKNADTMITNVILATFLISLPPFLFISFLAASSKMVTLSLQGPFLT